MSWAAVAGVAGSVIMGALDKETGEPASTSNQQLSKLTPEQQALLKKMIGEIMGQGNVSGTTPYEGQLGADLSSLQQTSLSGLEARALQQVTGGSQLDQTAQDSLTKAMTGPGIATDDYIKTNVEQPATRYWLEQLMPALEGRFKGSNLYSGQARETEARTMRDVGESVNKTSADIRFQSDKAKQDQIMQALGLYPDVANRPLNELLATLNAGAVPQQTQQNKLTLQYEEFKRQQQDKLQKLLAALGVQSFENLTTVSGASPGIFGGQGGAVGYLTGSKAGPAIAEYLK